jgi:hypothetical protein
MVITGAGSAYILIMETGGGAGSSQHAAPDDKAAGTPAVSSTPDPATASGSPNAGGPGETTTSVKPRRRKFKLVKWQTTIVGIAAAAATIIAAYITTHGGPPAPAPTSTASPPGPTPAASIASENFVHVPPPPTLRWTFYGGITDPPAFGGYAVYVIIPNPRPAAVLAHKWLVSPAARLSADGSWQVRWTLSLPGQGRFRPVIIYGAPTSGIVTLPPGQVIVADLRRYGPAAAKPGHFRIGIGNLVSSRAGSRA